MKFLLIFISAFLLFFLFTPGILGNLFPKGRKFSNVIIHSLVFSILFTILLQLIKQSKFIEGQGLRTGMPCSKTTINKKGILDRSYNDNACSSGRCNRGNGLCLPPVGDRTTAGTATASSGILLGSIADRVACTQDGECMSGQCDRRGVGIRACRPRIPPDTMPGTCRNARVDEDWHIRAECNNGSSGSTYVDSNIDISDSIPAKISNCQGQLISGDCSAFLGQPGSGDD